MGGEDPQYLVRVRNLPCAAEKYHPCCDGIVRHRQLTLRHAHHMREGAHAGTGQKPHDHDTVPFCDFHHELWHRFAYPFQGTPEMRLMIADLLVYRTRQLVTEKVAREESLLLPGVKAEVEF